MRLEGHTFHDNLARQGQAWPRFRDSAERTGFHPGLRFLRTWPWSARRSKGILVGQCSACTEQGAATSALRDTAHENNYIFRQSLASLNVRRYKIVQAWAPIYVRYSSVYEFSSPLKSGE